MTGKAWGAGDDALIGETPSLLHPHSDFLCEALYSFSFKAFSGYMYVSTHTWPYQELDPRSVPLPNPNARVSRHPALPPDWACPFLSLELSIQPSLNAILIPPHLRSPGGTATLTPSSQGKLG